MRNSSNKSIATEARLNQALERLIQGVPKRTKCDGRVNLKRINDEAGLSSGSIYYYKDFVEKAKNLIADLKVSSNKISLSSDHARIAKLRLERDKQGKLKIRYRDQRDKVKKFADSVVHENAKLHFALYEAQIRIEQLETALTASKVTKLSSKVK